MKLYKESHGIGEHYHLAGDPVRQNKIFDKIIKKAREKLNLPTYRSVTDADEDELWIRPNSLSNSYNILRGTKTLIHITCYEGRHPTFGSFKWRMKIQGNGEFFEEKIVPIVKSIPDNYYQP